MNIMNGTNHYNYENKSEKTTDRIILFLNGIYIALMPFYFWSSGLPQIADFILILSFSFYMLKNRFVITSKKKSRKFILFNLIFVIWILTNNFFWSIRLQSIEIAVNSLFYVYNFIVSFFYISLSIEYKEKLMRLMLNSSVISMVVQLIVIMGNGLGIGRITGSFNNPNQLGYYALLMASLIIFINEKIHVKGSKIIFGLMLSFALAILSLSNAAIISISFMYFMFMITKTKNNKNRRKIIFFAIVIIGILLYTYNNSQIIQSNSFYQSLENRISRTADKIENSSEERGYYRISEYPEYWLFGAGEGENARFDSHIEFHSTIGNVQVSYGIVGSLVFLLLFFYAIKLNGFYMWYVIVSILLYGYSHNGIRNSLLWILLALMVGIGNHDFRKYTNDEINEAKPGKNI